MSAMDSIDSTASALARSATARGRRAVPLGFVTIRFGAASFAAARRRPALIASSP